MLMKCAAALLALSAAVPAWAQDRSCPPQAVEPIAAPATLDAIGVEQAIALALQNDLRRDAAGALVAAARTEGRIASLRPADQLQVQTEDFPRSGQTDSLDSLEITASYARVWERGGKRDAREALAARGVDVARAGAAISDNQIAYEVRRLYAAALVAAARQDVECMEIGHVTEIQAITAERVRRSVDPQLAASRISTELLTAQADFARFEQLEAAYTDQIAAMTGQAFAIDRSALFETPDIRSVDLSFANLPDLLALDAQQREARARVMLEEANRKANVTWSVGVRNFGVSDEVGLVTGFSIPLGTGARSSATAARARADERAIELEKRALVQRLVREATALRQSSVQAVTTLNTLDTSLIPEAAKALELAEQGYKRGALPFRDILDTHEVLINLHKQRVDHLETYLMNDAALQRLSGDAARLESQP